MHPVESIFASDDDLAAVESAVGHACFEQADREGAVSLVRSFRRLCVLVWGGVVQEFGVEPHCRMSRELYKSRPTRR